jgi:hypothetical protein
MMRLILLCMIAGLLAALPACHKTSAGLFDQLYASDFGLDIHFGQRPAEVQLKLGRAFGSTERSSGASVTEYYLAEGESELDSATPQLSLLYLNDALIGVYNRYYPDDSKRAFPPYFSEIAPKVKLGSRKSEFVAALGDPVGGPESDEWRISARDGRAIQVTARFVEVQAVGEALCCSLNISFIPAVGQLRGEEYEKQEALKKKIHEQATGKPAPDKAASDQSATGK